MKMSRSSHDGLLGSCLMLAYVAYSISTIEKLVGMWPWPLAREASRMSRRIWRQTGCMALFDFHVGNPRRHRHALHPHVVQAEHLARGERLAGKDIVAQLVEHQH